MLFEYKNIPCPDNEGKEFSPEENATLGRLIVDDGNVLTAGFDIFSEKKEKGPLVSQYYFAQWLVWNYWRLRWEGRTNAADWGDAHRMVTIGEGYSWPDITIFSNGENIIFDSQPSPKDDRGSFEYEGCKIAHLIAPKWFDDSLIQYVEQVLGDLKRNELGNTNLHTLWVDLQNELNTPELAEKRRFEALLGYDPDEGDEKKIAGLIEFSRNYDERDVREIAAQYGVSGQFLTLAELEGLAKTLGLETKISDSVSLKKEYRKKLPEIGSCAAWKIGEAGAQALRLQEKLGDGLISSERLAEMFGASAASLQDRAKGSEQKFAFAFEKDKKASSVLSQGTDATRRFEMARLLGDRLIYGGRGAVFRFSGRMQKTYRQQVQRAFATELLAPFTALERRLEGDYSSETISEVAEYYQVSPMNIHNSLRNHGLIEEEYADYRYAA